MIWRAAGGDEATRLLICSSFSFAASIAARQEKNPRLQRDSRGCSPQRGLTALRRQEGCSRMQIRLRAKPHAIGEFEKKNNKKKNMTVWSKSLGRGVFTMQHQPGPHKAWLNQHSQAKEMTCYNVENTAWKFQIESAIPRKGHAK